MAARTRLSSGIVAAGLFTAAVAAAQERDVRPPEDSALRLGEAMVVLDYQVIPVTGDKPIDLMGFHLNHKVAEGLYLGAGVYAPLVRGEYGGFTAYDLGAHVQRRIAGRWFATAGLFGGGGGGGRSIEESKVLSGTGRFYKAYAGLGYDFDGFALGVNVAKMKFARSSIDGTQANVFVQIPYSYLTGPITSHGERLAPEEARLAAESSGESMLTVVFDNFRQIDPEGSYQGNLNIADVQYAHFIDRDTYWYGGLGVGYRGLPLYNHVIGGLGRRVPLSARFALYGQLGVGSGGYAPRVMETDAGLMVYPKVALEYALTRDLGVSLSAGYLVAPKGSSKNRTWGIALTHHLRPAQPGSSDDAPLGEPRYRGFRVGLFQQTETAVRYRDIDRGRLQMLAIQIDTLLDPRWYLPVQASVAYSSYLGYPGYGELLAGLGWQTRAEPGERLQGFAQAMAGANVHGRAVKAVAGVRYGLGERLALQFNAGRIEARGSSGQRFTANSIGLGLDYRFSVAGW